MTVQHTTKIVHSFQCPLRFHGFSTGHAESNPHTRFCFSNTSLTVELSLAAPEIHLLQSSTKAHPPHHHKRPEGVTTFSLPNKCL